MEYCVESFLVDVYIEYEIANESNNSSTIKTVLLKIWNWFVTKVREMVLKIKKLVNNFKNRQKNIRYKSNTNQESPNHGIRNESDSGSTIKNVNKPNTNQSMLESGKTFKYILVPKELAETTYTAIQFMNNIKYNIDSVIEWLDSDDDLLVGTFNNMNLIINSANKLEASFKKYSKIENKAPVLSNDDTLYNSRKDEIDEMNSILSEISLKLDKFNMSIQSKLSKLESDSTQHPQIISKLKSMQEKVLPGLTLVIRVIDEIQRYYK